MVARRQAKRRDSSIGASSVPGVLYVVATPIGNLEDLSPRAVRILRTVRHVFTEDTRVARTLLHHTGSQARPHRFDRHRAQRTLPLALDLLAREAIALTSDAGTPGVSDPGRELVAAALSAGYRVEPIPGPSALTTLVAVSPLIVGPFLFAGFAPARGPDRRAFFARLARAEEPVVLFEAPHRLRATLAELLAQGDREATIGRELTKLHEEIVHGKLSDLATRLAEPRGEFTLVVAPPARAPATTDDGQIVGLARALVGQGMRPRAAARELARQTGLAGSAAYTAIRRAGAGESGRL